MLKEYSAQATSYAARCKPDTLRNWRRLGYFDGLSERKGKGHLFTISDVARVVVAAFLARSGADLRDAFQIVSQRGGMIDAIAAQERSSVSTNDYFLSFTLNPDCSFPESITGAPIERIAFTIEPTAVLQVNVSRLIRSAFDRLYAFEKASAETVA